LPEYNTLTKTPETESEVVIRKEEGLEIRESHSNYTIELTLPGLVRNDLVIETTGRYLTVYLERDRDESLSRVQGNYDSLIRAFVIPGNVTKNKINTRCQNGVLRIQLRKKTQQHLRRVGDINDRVCSGIQRAMNAFRNIQGD
jgi:HSP20 family molecular chaperone IbpA